MNRTWPHTALMAIVLAVAIATSAHARNSSNARGIQTTIQAFKEEKRTLEGTQKLFSEAVIDLRHGLAEDPQDREAWLYLATAYAELDSLDKAGPTFAEAIRRAQDDPGLLKRARDHRDYFFVLEYNTGLMHQEKAEALLDLSDSTGPQASEARAKLTLAEACFRGALVLNPEKAIAYEALARLLVLRGQTQAADLVIIEGLKRSMPKGGDEYQRLVSRKPR